MRAHDEWKQKQLIEIQFKQEQSKVEQEEGALLENQNLDRPQFRPKPMPFTPLVNVDLSSAPHLKFPIAAFPPGAHARALVGTKHARKERKKYERWSEEDVRRFEMALEAIPPQGLYLHPG